MCRVQRDVMRAIEEQLHALHFLSVLCQHFISQSKPI